MLKFVQKIVNFKITWKLRLKFFYFLSMIHGLGHFTYEENRKKVRLSFISVAYGCVWVVGYFLFMLKMLSSIDRVVDDIDGQYVQYLVNVIDMTTIALKACSFHFLRIIHSKDLVRLMNDAIDINQTIDEYRENFSLYDRHFVKLYNLKKWCSLLQSLMFIVCFCIYAAEVGDDIRRIIFSSVVLYTHFYTLIVSGLYFYGSLIFASEFYYSLNSKLIQVLNKINVDTKSRPLIENYCDEFDKISLLYTRISSYVESINRIFAVEIAFQLLTSFIMITCSVSHFPFRCDNLRNQ